MKTYLAVLLLLSVPVSARDWTDAAGKHHVSAELADLQGGVVYLKKNDGRFAAVPLSKLSKADQAFVRSSTPAIQTIEGKVVGVSDGDTLTVLVGSTPTKIRLQGIDAPEGHQAFGTKSKEALASKVFQKSVRVEWRELDQYRRTLGHVFIDGKWVNRELVREGWAWHYREYSKSEILAVDESDARTAKVGLWSDQAAIPPWQFRKSELADTQAPSESKSDSGTGDSEAGRYFSDIAVEQERKQAVTQPRETESSQSPPVDRNPNNEVVSDRTPTGLPIFTGPRGGRYHYSKSGKKVYERRRR